MANTSVKIKKTVKKNGMTAISLITYLGYTKDVNGKIKTKRKSETLNYSLYYP